MIQVNEKLKILHDDNGSFLDFSRKLASFGRDTSTLDYVAAEDSFYIGFYKPISTFYVHFSVDNASGNELSVKYYNGTSFVDVTSQHDDTAGFERNGFVSWDRDLTNEAKTTVNSTELYWYRLDLTSDLSASILGLNIVFCDDQDLKRELYEIDRFLPSGETSHILTLEACRDEIVQDLNLQGKAKKNLTSGWLEGITAFDLLFISEVKLASTYLAMAKIFFNVNDQSDDTYLQKSEIYRSKYNNIINSITLSVDSDNDGKPDKIERDNIIRGIIKRE